MRFKKVEISAFRIYDQPADATFDFTLKSGEAAKFISLYAPNGFGKTSFYDAVEWGMTDNIQRFWQNELFMEAMKSQKGASDEQVKVLRNTLSSRKTKTYVKITTDGPEHSRMLKPHGNKKWDIADSDSYENRTFRKVILSQEWISAFLKEVDSEKRFALFMDNPDLTGLNAYYRNLTDLLAANAATIATLNTDIEKEKKYVVEVREGNLLETINASIKQLQAKKEPLTLIKLNTTNKEALELVNYIASRRISFADKIKSGSAFLDFLAAALAGNEEVSGVALYFEQLTGKAAADTELGSIEQLLNIFKELEACSAEEKNLGISREENLKKITDLETIRARFAGYRSTADSLKLKEAASANEQAAGKAAQEPLKALQKAYTDLKNRLNFNFSQQVDLEAKVKNYPTLKVAFDSLREHLDKCDQDIALITRRQSEVNNDLQQFQQEIKTVRAQLDHVQSGDYGRLMQPLQDAHRERLKKMLENKGRLVQFKETLQKISEQIDRQQSFNKELEEFVKQGMELIDRAQTDECPLCNHHYDSYKELAEKVAANNLLDNALQELIGAQTKTQQELTALQATIAADEDLINAAINKLMIGLNHQVSQQKQAADNLKNELKITEQNKVRNKTELDQLSRELAGETLETYLKTTARKLKELQSLHNNLSQELKELETQMDPMIEAGQIAAVKIKLLDEDITVLRGNADYTFIQNWFKENDPKTPPSAQTFTNLINALHTKNETIKARLQALAKTRDDLAKKSAKSDRTQLIKRKDELTKMRESLIKSIAGYQDYVARFTNIDVAAMDHSTLLSALEELRTRNQEAVAREKNLDTSYQLLSEYTTNLLPYLQSENARVKILGYQAELAELKNDLQPALESEKKAVRVHLEERIKSFFYTGLINQIYNKIDPHPEFKAVEFKANFDVPAPTLDVFVTNEKREQTSIPNLYFSSAQINILSLSIFLASALNSKEYDCIFIDDPIQSMDSINVLSTIDLLRSIVINEKKQIILSTHDVNFHNLLKKKMPPDLFDSKFLELESFGKVKESS